MLTKAAIIISAILVFAGVAAAGTLTSGSSGDTPTVQNAPLPTTTNDDVQQEDRRANEPGEDLRGPCDEAEHANDPRCTGAAGADDRGADHGVDDNDHHGQNSGHGGDDGSSGHGGSNSGHGGGEDD
jgi:hypothetical protein